MRNICVVTGGGSGIGLATAKLMGTNHDIILVGRTVKKLEDACLELQDMGINADSFPCDVSDCNCVRKLVSYAQGKGHVKAVIHAAGMSPQMASGEVIFTVNAMSTIYINEEFGKVMEAGSCIVNVASMMAYMIPEENIPRTEYPQSLTNAQAFQAAIHSRIAVMPPEAAEVMSYIISKNFVVWYSAQSACLYGKKGVRVLSVSPGCIDTEMGNIAGEEAIQIAKNGALGRMGHDGEVAQLMAFAASDAASYLTGTDILCDGGTIAAMQRQ